MKSKFNLLVALFSFAFLFANAEGEEAQKEFHEKWPASGVETLNISNKYGEIKINNDGGPDVTIDVMITVEASSKGKASKILDLIEVDFSKSGSTIKAVTKIDNNFKSAGNFNIDYTVNIPSDKNLVISNTFGNLFINALKANGDLNVKHGSITANMLQASSPENMKLNLEYGKMSVDELAGAVFDCKYSKVSIDELGDLKLRSKYSTFSVDEMKSLDAESKYDNFSIDEIESVKASTQYTNINIDRLGDKFEIDNGYGSIKVDEISENFSSVYITNSYGGIKLGISEDASYEVDASCTYCKIAYDADNFRGDRIEQSHTKSIKGMVGDGSSSAKVYIKSKYGTIKLNE